MKKIAVGLLGCTGMVGQHYIALLHNHPWFELNFLASSEKSCGRSYSQALHGRWQGREEIPEKIAQMPVFSVEDVDLAFKCCKFVFSALSEDAAAYYEPLYAKAELAVISNASYYRQFDDVPIVIPEINPEHFDIISLQKKKRGWTKGFIVTKPNCSLQSYMIPLAPLHRALTVKKIMVTTLQAVSGGGYPGVSSLDIINNVIPHIPKEEDKTEQEPLKIWGSCKASGIELHPHMTVSSHCNRVSVVDGHMACVSVQFEKKSSLEGIRTLWNEFEGVPKQLQLPSAPSQPIIYLSENDRPQPRKDCDRGKGMSVCVGRLRSCPILDIKFTALSHNIIRGAAGGGILNAELLYKKGYINEA